MSLEETVKGFPLRDVLRLLDMLIATRDAPERADLYERISRDSARIKRRLESSDRRLSDYPLAHSLNVVLFLYHLDGIGDVEKLDAMLGRSFATIQPHTETYPVLQAALECIESLARRNFGDRVYFIDGFQLHEIEDPGDTDDAVLKRLLLLNAPHLRGSSGAVIF